MSTWTTENKCKLLLAVICKGGSSKHCNWEEIASIMGPGFGWNGCSQQFNKLKREFVKELGPEAKSFSNEAAASIETPTSKSKTSKSGAGKASGQKANSKNTGGKKRKTCTEAECHEGEEGVAHETDSSSPKKPKLEADEA